MEKQRQAQAKLNQNQAKKRYVSPVLISCGTLAETTRQGEAPIPRIDSGINQSRPI